MLIDLVANEVSPCFGITRALLKVIWLEKSLHHVVELKWLLIIHVRNDGLDSLDVLILARRNHHYCCLSRLSNLRLTIGRRRRRGLNHGRWLIGLEIETLRSLLLLLRRINLGLVVWSLKLDRKTSLGFGNKGRGSAFVEVILINRHLHSLIICRLSTHHLIGILTIRVPLWKISSEPPWTWIPTSILLTTERIVDGAVVTSVAKRLRSGILLP